MTRSLLLFYSSGGRRRELHKVAFTCSCRIIKKLQFSILHLDSHLPSLPVTLQDMKVWACSRLFLLLSSLSFIATSCKQEH